MLEPKFKGSDPVMNVLGFRPAESLSVQTLHGLQWSYLGTGVNSLLQIAFTAIMARLLEPTAFGLVAMSGVILRFGSYFAQMGVGSALVQKKEISDNEIYASFSFSVLFGIVFYAIAWFLAPLALNVFDVPAIVLLIQVSALSFVISGLSTTALALLRRDLAFKRLAIIEMVSYVVGYGLVGILLAYKGYGVWSLVISSLSQSVFLFVLAYGFSPHHVSLRFRWTDYRQLYSFGSRVSLISFVEFLALQLDKLVIGHYIGANALGLYDRAYITANLPINNFATSLSKVLFPAFSRIQAETHRLLKTYFSSVMLVTAFIVPAAIGISAASEEIVLLLLGAKWVDAIPVLRILAIGAAFNFLSLFSGILCEATATLNVKISIQLCQILFLSIAFYFLTSIGIYGIAVAVTSGEFLRFVAYLGVTKKLFRMSTREVLAYYKPGFYIGAITGISIYAISFTARQTHMDKMLSFLIEVIAGVSILFYFCCFNQTLPIRNELKHRLASAGALSDTASASGKLLKWFYRMFLAS